MLYRFISTVYAMRNNPEERHRYYELIEKILDHSSHLSPEDQAKQDKAFDLAAGISTKIDAAQQN